MKIVREEVHKCPLFPFPLRVYGAALGKQGASSQDAQHNPYKNTLEWNSQCAKIYYDYATAAKLIQLLGTWSWEIFMRAEACLHVPRTHHTPHAHI